ncbi:MAG TPA: hypothetical protein VH144_03620 [Candidatus Saccharimonadales bacterium]|jgi:hypothetical protein|nr:hypothetical protein [Candidatus Saccharimonadales bacterium]
MLFVALVSWWYGVGWVKQALILRTQIMNALDTFSIGLLLRTLFSPFRQISAGGVRGPLGVKLRAWFDRLVSRFVGAGVRLIVIAIGIVYLAFVLVFGIVRCLAWPLIPLLPAIALLLFGLGVAT